MWRLIAFGFSMSLFSASAVAIVVNMSRPKPVECRAPVPTDMFTDPRLRVACRDQLVYDTLPLEARAQCVAVELLELSRNPIEKNRRPEALLESLGLLPSLEL